MPQKAFYKSQLKNLGWYTVKVILFCDIVVIFYSIFLCIKLILHHEIEIPREFPLPEAHPLEPENLSLGNVAHSTDSDSTFHSPSIRPGEYTVFDQKPSWTIYKMTNKK